METDDLISTGNGEEDSDRKSELPGHPLRSATADFSLLISCQQSLL